MPLELELDQIFTPEVTETVVYSRGTSQITLDVIPDESVFEITSPEGAIIEYRTKDFIAKCADLDFGSGQVEPNRKDRITLERDGTETTFEVLPEPPLQHFRRVDGYGFCFRIHTKEKPAA